MRRIFNLLLGALAMLAVALVSAFLTLRLAIHGREVAVPNVAGESINDATLNATRLGLNVTIENRFYSTTVPAGLVLSQSPQPGTRVRRQWALRITESLGPQSVSVPNVIGQTERAASVNIRRLSLELGTVAYLPVSGPAGIVLTQTPMPNAMGIDGPRISLLVSEAMPATATGRGAALEAIDDAGSDSSTDLASAAISDRLAGAGAQMAQDAVRDGADEGTTQPNATAGAEAFLMPSLIGLTLGEASTRVTAMGLHISSIEAKAAAIQPVAPIDPGKKETGPGTQSIAPIAPITLANTVVAQHPEAGRKVTVADRIHITLSR